MIFISLCPWLKTLAGRSAFPFFLVRLKGLKVRDDSHQIRFKHVLIGKQEKMHTPFYFILVQYLFIFLQNHIIFFFKFTIFIQLHIKNLSKRMLNPATTTKATCPNGQNVKVIVKHEISLVGLLKHERTEIFVFILVEVNWDDFSRQMI